MRLLSMFGGMCGWVACAGHRGLDGASQTGHGFAVAGSWEEVTQDLERGPGKQLSTRKDSSNAVAVSSTPSGFSLLAIALHSK